MKTRLIVRHAKAQPDALARDHARTLTSRERRDASTIGDYVPLLVGVPDAIVTSDARRALEPAELIAAGCQFAALLTVESDIYAADAGELARIVRRFPDATACVVIVGHNPVMQALIALLTGFEGMVKHLPTAGIARLEHDSDRWWNLVPGACRFRGITFPQLLGDRSDPSFLGPPPPSATGGWHPLSRLSGANPVLDETPATRNA